MNILITQHPHSRAYPYLFIEAPSIRIRVQSQLNAETVSFCVPHHFDPERSYICVVLDQIRVAVLPVEPSSYYVSGNSSRWRGRNFFPMAIFYFVCANIAGRSARIGRNMSVRKCSVANIIVPKSEGSIVFWVGQSFEGFGRVG